jgi:predicted transcriptional regulator
MPHFDLVINAQGGDMNDSQATTATDAIPKKASAESKNALVEKWGKETMAVGFTVVPSILLRSQKRLGINANELAVLVHLMEHWWQTTGMPWPSKRKIAERLDVHEKTVQRAAAKLESLKLIKRVSRYLEGKGRTTNGYDLSLLVERLKEISIEVAKVDAEAETKKWKAHNIAPKVKMKVEAEKAKAA